MRKKCQVWAKIFTESRNSLLGHLSAAGSLQTFDQVQVGQHAMIPEDARLAVGRNKNGAYVFHAGGIRWHERLPQGALSTAHIEAKDSRRQLAGLIDVERAPIGAPGDRPFSKVEAGNHSRFAPGDGEQITP